MKGTIRWMQVTPSTNEFQYDLGQEEIDTEKESVRDTMVRLLTHEWDTFGESGDCIVIDMEEEVDNMIK